MKKKTARSRAALPGSVPKREKRVAGRTTAATTPAAFRTDSIDASQALRQHTRERLGMKLGKFASRVERVTVRVSDVNGPKGGVDKICRVKAVLVARPTVVVEQRDHDAFAAVDGALDRLARAVSASLARRRLEPRVRARKSASKARTRGGSRASVR
jgi:ribosome-associated translation inhibitor RaiA